VVARNIDEVVSALDDIIAEQRARKSVLAYFPALYRAVTVRVRDGILNGQFDDGDRMNRLDTCFANRYFAAYDAWRNQAAPSRAWRIAFDAAAEPDLIILQHLLLGINAHINLDLPVAAVESVAGAPIQSLERDFLTINQILASLLDPVQATVDRFSPLLDVLDRVGGRTDEAVVNFSIKASRDEAWHEAVRLAGEPAEQRARSVFSLDRRVKLLAGLIRSPGGLCGPAVELIARMESRDVPAITDALLAIR